MVFVGRELRPKSSLGCIQILEFLGSDQILREVHVDDPALSIEDDKQVVSHSSEFNGDENQLLFGSLACNYRVFDPFHTTEDTA